MPRSARLLAMAVIGATLLLGPAETPVRAAGAAPSWLWPVAGPGVSLDQAVRRARRSGKVLSADTVDEGGRRVHRVRVLTDEGRVRRFRYDAGTGQPVPRGQAPYPGRR
jgi:hypothetical protein